MKASFELTAGVRSRDIQQFLHRASGDENKKLFIYKKDKNLFLTTDSTEAAASGKSRKDVLASIKAAVKKSGYAGEVQTLFRDIRNLAQPSTANGEKNFLEDENSYLTLTSGQLTFLLKHRSDPNLLISHESRGIIIDNSISSLRKSLQKYSTTSAPSSADRSDEWQKEGKAIGENLANNLMSNFKQENPYARPVEKAIFKISFLTNEIKEVKKSIKDYCDKELSQNIADDKLEAIATGLQESVANIHPSAIKKFSIDNSEPFSLPTKLDMDGEIYKLVKPESVGKGGHGVVHMYGSRTQPQEFIAVKSPVNCNAPEDIIESNKVSQNELTTHLRAQGISHENVVEVKGAFMADGKLCIALEDCSLGKLDSFGAKKLISNQNLSPDDIGLVLLTLGRDALRGLAFLHIESGVMHTDFKPQNVFIGTDGKAKIGDFDQSASGINTTRDLRSIPDGTPQYMTPSLLKKTREYRESIKNINEKYDPLWFKEKDQAKRKEINKEKIRQHSLIDSSVSLSQSDDIFAAGVTLYELYFGSNPFFEDKEKIESSEISLRVEEYGQMKTRERSNFLFKGKKIATGLEQQAGEIKAVISGLMHPDPAKRLSVSDALQSPVFTENEIRTNKARNLIMQIGMDTSTDASSEES